MMRSRTEISINDLDQRRVEKLHAEGFSGREIAKRFGVHSSMIYRILREIKKVKLSNNAVPIVVFTIGLTAFGLALAADNPPAPSQVTQTLNNALLGLGTARDEAVDVASKVNAVGPAVLAWAKEADERSATLAKWWEDYVNGVNKQIEELQKQAGKP